MGVLCPEEKDASSSPWVPRSQKQMGMTAQEIEIDNYCREVMTILNKVTPQNIDILLDKLANLELNSEFYIEKLVKYIVCKAEGEPLYCELYAEMCCTLNQVVDRYISSTEPSKSMTDSTATVADVSSVSLGIFKKLIMKECFMAFDEVFNTDFCESNSSDGTFMLHEHRQKAFGAMQFIGQLYNVEFFQDDVMLKMIGRLLNDENKTLEFQIECLCRLLRTVGATMESHGKKSSIEHIFQELKKVNLGNEFCSRVKFSVLDLVELRQNNWVCRHLVETPMTIDELRTTYVNPDIVKRKKKKKKQKN